MKPLVRVVRVMVVAAAAGTFAFGCTSPTAPPTGHGDPSIAIQSGNGQIDTIDTFLAARLVVHVVGGVPGQAVHFSSAFRPGGFAEALVGARAHAMDTAYETPIDASLNAAALVQLGDIADSAFITIATQGATSTTASFLVTHGQAVALTASDTAIYIGTAATLRATLVDRRKNPVPTQASYALVSGPASLANATVTSDAFGLANVLATAGGFSDTIQVSMVPHGELAAASDSLGIVVFNLDGSGFHALTRVQATFLQWVPAGNAVLFDRSLYAYTEGSHHGGIYFVDTAGTITSPDSARPDSIADYEPQISYDGAWIYFLSFAPSFMCWVRRMHPDGTGLESIDSTSGKFTFEFPAASAGDTLLTYDNGFIRMRRVGSAGPPDSLSLGTSARWSPTAQQFVFLGPIPMGSASFGPLDVMTPGGAPRPIGSPAKTYDPNPQWSPDGQYVATASFAAASK